MQNFGGLTEDHSRKDLSQIAIVPVPYDGTSTWIKGADKGPQAILEASANMELYDIETNSEVYRNGIFTAGFITESESPEKMVGAVYNEVNNLIGLGKFPVIIGGEHSVSIGSILAFAQNFSDLSVLQIDAHSDMRDEYEGSKNNHACVMARAREVSSIVQVGIRSCDSEELPSIDTKRVFFAHQIHDNDEWMEKAVSMLTKNVYITIDLDAFDPSIMPSTGTPEPGGMGWYQVITFVEKVIAARKLVGFDVVELCPSEGNKAPDFMAAKLIYKILSLKFTRTNEVK
jgi:agmatinase